MPLIKPYEKQLGGGMTGYTDTGTGNAQQARKALATAGVQYTDGGSFGRTLTGGNSGGGSSIGGSGVVPTPAPAAPSLDYSAILADARAAKEKEANRLRGSLYDAAQKTYDTGVGQLNTAADRSLQENYLARRIAERNLNQQLATAGRSGGAAESTMLGLANSYANARGNVETARLEGLSQLAQQLAQQKAAADQTVSGYLLDDAGGYQTALQNALAQQQSDYADQILKQYESIVQNAGRGIGAGGVGSGAGNTQTAAQEHPGSQFINGTLLAGMRRAMVNNPKAAEDDSATIDYLRGLNYTDPQIAAYLNNK